MSAGCHHHHHGRGTEKALNITLAVNVVLTVAKWTAFIFTRSSSLFAEAIHSTFDTMNPLVLKIGHHRSQHPKCDRHPMGHTREGFFWPLIAAIMMFAFGAVFTAYRGIHSLITGHVPEMYWWAAAILIGALVFEGISLLVSHRALKGEDIRKTKNTTVLALVFENFVDMLGVTLALTGYGLFLLTGQAIWDAVFSIAIACLLAYASIFLIHRNMSLITGESADEETVERIRSIAKGVPSVMKVTGLTVFMTGPEDMCCRMSVVLDAPKLADMFESDGRADGTGREAIYWTLLRVAIERQRIKRRLFEEFPGMQSVHVEIC
ncbi:MAG: cation diffusion facilitator family transporter [Patescibacteria group bacterium]|nr:cation diffusion facilitator family transporter [Patescibacteria group bacterium]